jgi:uncharacterized protein
VEVFDCNACFGDSARPAFRYARTAAALEEEMDFSGIDEALVYHAGMRFGDPAAWNSRLSAEIAGRPRLRPTWAILPSQTGEQPEPRAFLLAMAESGVRALRAFPQEQHYPLDGSTFGPLLEMLADRRIPLLVKDNLAAIGRLLGEFPDLTVVAVSQGPHSLERYLRPLVERYPNLYIDTSCYLVEGLIEELCGRYGPDRLLYGSGFPDNAAGGPFLRLAAADIGRADREAVACGNLRRMLEEARI